MEMEEVNNMRGDGGYPSSISPPDEILLSLLYGDGEQIYGDGLGNGGRGLEEQDNDYNHYGGG